MWAQRDLNPRPIDYESKQSFVQSIPKETFGTSSKEDIKLSKKWKKYSLNLKRKDLTQIKTGFVWATYSSGFPVTFYLDDIQYE